MVGIAENALVEPAFLDGQRLGDPIQPADLRHEAEVVLAEGHRTRKSPWRCLAMASVSADGTPEVRYLVLRDFDRAVRQLRFHTDIRSPKWSELQQRPTVSVIGYDPARQLQVRLRGAATCHHDNAIAKAAWDGSPRMSRACYAAVNTLGAKLQVPPPATTYCETGAANFGLITFEYTEMEVLKLSSGGHRRARFLWLGSNYEESWLAP